MVLHKNNSFMSGKNKGTVLSTAPFFYYGGLNHILTYNGIPPEPHGNVVISFVHIIYRCSLLQLYWFLCYEICKRKATVFVTFLCLS